MNVSYLTKPARRAHKSAMDMRRATGAALVLGSALASGCVSVTAPNEHDRVVACDRPVLVGRESRRSPRKGRMEVFPREGWQGDLILERLRRVAQMNYKQRWV